MEKALSEMGFKEVHTEDCNDWYMICGPLLFYLWGNIDNARQLNITCDAIEHPESIPDHDDDALLRYWSDLASPNRLEVDDLLDLQCWVLEMKQKYGVTTAE